MKIKQCPDGYTTCRKAEATEQWCEGRCHADDPTTERQWLEQAHKMLVGLCRSNKMAALHRPEYGATSAGNFTAELGSFLKERAK